MTVASHSAELVKISGNSIRSGASLDRRKFLSLAGGSLTKAATPWQYEMMYSCISGYTTAFLRSLLLILSSLLSHL